MRMEFGQVGELLRTLQIHSNDASARADIRGNQLCRGCFKPRVSRRTESRDEQSSRTPERQAVSNVGAMLSPAPSDPR